MNLHDDILGLIGNTPLVRINNITREHKVKAPIYAKMESLNPGYSVIFDGRLGRTRQGQKCNTDGIVSGLLPAPPTTPKP